MSLQFTNYKYQAILEELQSAEEHEFIMQAHLQKVKDIRGLEQLQKLRERISTLQAYLDNAQANR